MTDIVTEMSDLHRAVVRWLEALGLEVMEEVPFPPYRVDVYLPAYHVAVEADGPAHAGGRDARRDAELARVYGLPVYHIMERDVRTATDRRRTRGELEAFLRLHRATAAERWERCRDRTPWL